MFRNCSVCWKGGIGMTTRAGGLIRSCSVSAGVIMRGGHCLKVWTKKQQVMSLSTAESELYAAVKTASEVFWIQSVAKDLGISCGLNLHLDASATMCLVNHRGLAKRSTSTCRICGHSHEEGRHEREPSRVNDETLVSGWVRCDIRHTAMGASLKKQVAMGDRRHDEDQGPNLQ